jgi:hypothetical protein
MRDTGRIVAGKEGPHPVVAPSSIPALDADPIGFQYPASRWRLATFEELGRATLWVGHIAIRHNRSQVDLFRPPGWRPDSPNPARTVAEALALAEEVRAKAARQPAEFERLAREYSDDVVSKDEGGMLGGVRANQFESSEFLDALAVLKPGDISLPIRTPYGFHIIKRYAPPIEQLAAGERIVIGYQGTVGLATESHRSRAAAKILATEIAEEAKKNASEFGAFVERYSESVDRAVHGDIGVYSTRDPGFLPIEVHVLAGIAVGEVTGPVETRFGFEILKRVPARPRVTYAMAAIEVLANPGDGDRDTALALALGKAQGVLRELESNPGRFQEFQRIYCCDSVQRWSEGQGDLELTRALGRLSFGEVARTPLLQGTGYWIVKRLDPRTLPHEAPRLTDLPQPNDPDYESIVGGNDGVQIASALRALLGDAKQSTKLPPTTLATTTEVVERVVTDLEKNQADKRAVRATLHAAYASLEKQLGAERFEQLTTFGRRWVIRQMMPPGSVD